MPHIATFDEYQKLESFIENLERDTTSRFITQRISNKRHFSLQPGDVLSLNGHKILWQDCQETASPSVEFDGTPYINIGWMVKECHHGPDRQRRAKEKKKQRRVSCLYPW
ncbi:uncharacterized protein LOC134248949 [Saccostrea cucullata]|uniref:uncharacterized protein LOC134248949 n=1 Tax=Saccostrea cuccullata TaxID=36930 RepID=UPI002ED41EBF